MKIQPHHRLALLGAVNALILLHIVLYYAFDRRAVGCVDFFGLATFLGKGQVTAGTIFLGAIILITLLLGRVFCGWGCHFALFQDLLAKAYVRIGWRIPFRRSRMEFVVPPLLFVLTLLYPIASWWQRNGLPGAVETDLAYPEVWHLLPGAKGVALILLVDVVLLTALFGSRAFCRYLCPYGLFLKFFHVIAPVRVVAIGDCSNCGACTRACPTGVPIKYEVENFGVVRDLNCVNCGDCVAVCPSGALALRATRRAYSRGWLRGLVMPGQPMWAEALLLSGIVSGLLVYRGREYGDFLAAGMGLVLGAALVATVDPTRFASHRIVARWGILKTRAVVGAIALYLSAGVVGQALGFAVLKRAQRSLDAGDYEGIYRGLSRGARLAGTFRPFTFYLDDFDSRSERSVERLIAGGDRLMASGTWRDAEFAYRSVLALEADRIQARGNLGTALFKQGRYWDAAACYLAVLDFDPNDLVALYHLAMTRIQLGQFDEAAEIVEQILATDTVGNAYDLIRENPLFQLLNQHPDYQRVMAVYQPQRASGSPEGEINK